MDPGLKYPGKALLHVAVPRPLNGIGPGHLSPAPLDAATRFP